MAFGLQPALARRNTGQPTPPARGARASRAPLAVYRGRRACRVCRGYPRLWWADRL